MLQLDTNTIFKYYSAH